jgi:hypothetical protein
LFSTFISCWERARRKRIMTRIARLKKAITLFQSQQSHPVRVLFHLAELLRLYQSY